MIHTINKFTLLSLFIFTGCGIYKPYSSNDVSDIASYGDKYVTDDTLSIASMGWRELFTDSYLQQLIDEGLKHNTDLQTARWRIVEAEASLKTTRQAYIPTFVLSPNGNVSSFDKSKAAWSYTVPLSATWETDLFGKLTNAKRQAKAALEQSNAYKQAVQTGLVSSIANQYYSLLMLDKQYGLAEATLKNYKESVRTIKAMKKAGMSNEVAVAQLEAAHYAVATSMEDIKRSIDEIENALSTLTGQPLHHIQRGTLDTQLFPDTLKAGIPVRMLTQRPDVKAAENALAQAYYGKQIARAAFYPSLTLGGTAGWTNSLGSIIVNPGKLLLSATGSLVQPIFQGGKIKAGMKIAQAQYEEAQLAFKQSILSAGEEVNNALTLYQTAQKKKESRTLQIAALQKAFEKSKLLMQHSPNTYLDVLTAQQSLLAAQQSQATDQFESIQGIVNLYHALGGGTQ